MITMILDSEVITSRITLALKISCWFSVTTSKECLFNYGSEYSFWNPLQFISVQALFIKIATRLSSWFCIYLTSS